MSLININNELIIARNAILEAGKLLIKKKDTLQKEESSTKKDIKLKADIISESLIKDILSKNSRIPILAEESGFSKKVLSDIFWVVDPLDGTANYARSIPISCVSVALIAKGKPVLGVIYDFNNDDLYEGSVNVQACLNGNPIHVSKVESPEEGILLTGLPNDTDYSDDSLMTMVKSFQKWRKVRMIGSAAMAAMYVASGKADVYSEKRSYLWDIAAGAAIVNAAGGEALISNQNEKFQVDVRFSNSLIKT